MKNLPKNRVPVSVAIPYDLLEELQEIIIRENISRSDFIVGAIQEKIKNKK